MSIPKKTEPNMLIPASHAPAGKVHCLGKEFESESERREYFRNELQAKLPELKKLLGFPIGEDEDIIALSDPPYFTACPNPWLGEILDKWESDKLNVFGRSIHFEVLEPYANDVSEGKYDPMYLYHPYLTKVPHRAILKYILHYTQPGDIVLDGFAGTGMTGVAARMCGSLDIQSKMNIENEFYKMNLPFPKWGIRKAICSDLSPLASFVSYNYNIDYGNSEFVDKAYELLSKVKDECQWMYQTLHSNGQLGLINYILWSDVFVCPNCNSEIVFWDSAVDKAGGKVKESFSCPKCRSLTSKDDLTNSYTTIYDDIIHTSIKQNKLKPVLINYTYNKKRYEKVPDKRDEEVIDKCNSLNIPFWFPNMQMPEGDESRRNDKNGITHIHHFYSRRNFYALAKLKSLITNPIFNVIITKVAFQSTKLYRFTYQNGSWGAGGGPLSGTLYIPSLIKELNIINQFEEAIKSRKKLIPADTKDSVINSTQSASSLAEINDCSIDYIFTDPPFGSNLMYSELNILAESWLKVRTNNLQEAIINKSQLKTIASYQGLMTSCFKEYFRVLKHGKWMTVEFSNTSAAIWNAIQTSLQRAGFIIANVAGLDKKKESFKAITTPTAVKQDLVISCYKPTVEIENDFISFKGDFFVWDFVKEHLNRLPVHLRKGNSTVSIIERSSKILYDRLITFYLMRGLPIPIDSKEFQLGLKQRFIERDGMYFSEIQVAEYDDKRAKTPLGTQLALIVSNESDAIEWLKDRLRKEPQKYQDITNDWKIATQAFRKGDTLPELKLILEQGFIQESNGRWRTPDPSESKDREILRNTALMKDFNSYVLAISESKAKKLKEVRVEALRAGFKSCWERKDFRTIVSMGEMIPQNILLEDEQLLMFYDIAKDRI